MRTLFFWFIMLTGVVLVSLVLLEVAVRQLSWLTPESEAFDPEIGLSSSRITAKMDALRSTEPDLVFIGDSYVETGDLQGGWADLMRRGRGDTIVTFGFSGAAPGQYLQLYQLVREHTDSAFIVIVLYVGNDLIDEAVWLEVQPNAPEYLAARRARFANPQSDLFWPCYDPDIDPGSLSARLKLYHDFVRIAANRLRSVIDGSSRWEGIARLQRVDCSGTDRAQSFSGRLFFLPHHEAAVGAQVQADIVPHLQQIMRPLIEDDRAAVAVVYDREETCRSIHGRSVSSARPVLESLRTYGLQVFDPNAEFGEACLEDYPYLPDGHWNGQGHVLFAKAMTRQFDSLMATREN